MQIIKAKEEHADIVGEIHSNAWKQAYKGIFPSDYLAEDTDNKRKKEFEVSLEDETIDYYLLHDKEPAGIVKVKSSDESSEVLSMYLLEKCRNHGIGTYAIQHIIKKYVPKEIILWTLEDNESARKFYEKNGFFITGEERIIVRGKEFVQVQYKYSRRSHGGNDIFTEEDLFPREITSYEETEYGLLFYDEMNKESFDANHALIYKDKILNIEDVLEEIISFYQKKNIRPCIYQSISDAGYFYNNKDIFAKKGFECWEELQKYMFLKEENHIISNPEILVERVSDWDDTYATEIFEKAGEPWEIDVTKKVLKNKNTLFFVAYFQEKPVGMTRGHVSNNVCRVDYLLVSKEHRNQGVGRSLIYYFVEYCREQKIDKCYLWPDGETAEKIYYEAGFRTIDSKMAGRAMYKM